MLFAQISAFVAVAHCGSVSRAADELFITQPAVTARIHSLERELGEELFEHRGRGIRLSPAGAAFLPHAERMLAALHDGRASLAEVRHAGGRLALAATPGVSAYTLPAVLERLMHEQPQLNVSVRTGHSEDVLEMVLSEEVQLGIGRALRHAQIAGVPLYQDELVLVAAPTHHWSMLGSIALEDIGAERIILFDRQSSYYELTQALFREAGIGSPRAIEVDNIEAAKRMAERNLGVALLPRAAVLRDVAERRLHLVPIQGGPPIHRAIVAFRRHDVTPSPAVSAFLDVAARVIGPFGHVPPPARTLWIET